MTLSLLVGAGLLLRTLVAVYRADAIVDTSRLMLAWLSVSPEKYATPDRRMALYDQVLEALRRVPGIDDATVASAMPFYTAPVRPLEIEGRVRPPGTAPDRVCTCLRDLTISTRSDCGSFEADGSATSMERRVTRRRL